LARVELAACTAGFLGNQGLPPARSHYLPHNFAPWETAYGYFVTW
jgi:hypothetical protein